MIKLTQGNLLAAHAEALVNTVNTAGIMGRGIALQFKQAYPAMFRDYERACKAGEMKLGQVQVVDLGGLAGGPRWIINFPTKWHWRADSRMADIESGLKDLVALFAVPHHAPSYASSSAGWAAYLDWLSLEVHLQDQSPVYQVDPGKPNDYCFQARPQLYQPP